jgi:hypothetical protein
MTPQSIYKLIGNKNQTQFIQNTLYLWGEVWGPNIKQQLEN